MGILDDFITDMSKDVEEEKKEEVEKEKEKGGFDGDYTQSFLDYCKKGNRCHRFLEVHRGINQNNLLLKTVRKLDIYNLL